MVMLIVYGVYYFYPLFAMTSIAMESPGREAWGIPPINPLIINSINGNHVDMVFVNYHN